MRAGSELFDAIGFLVAIYVVYAIATGRVYEKSGIFARLVERDEAPFNFWSTVVIYAVLSVVLIVWL